ncbi:MAG: hypothetical protein NTZ05_13745, partial [Chloroflexi bacterium]|nr:hypothetical protein [Chloroflexota bacterium]
IKSSYIIEKTAGYALARQFGRAASELKNVGEVFFHQAAIAAAGQDMRLGCIVDSLKSFGAQPALVAKLAIDYGFWIYPVILDHFKYQNTPTAFSLVYAAAPAQELLRPLGFERGWVAFMKVPRPQRPPGQEEPYELWLLQSNGTRRIFIDRGPVVTFAGWLNDEEIVYAVSSDTSDTSNTDQSGVLYTSNIRTGVRHKLVSFVPNPKSAEFWLMQHGVRVSPDGKTIAYMDSNGIMLYELATGRERRLIQNINGGAFSKRSSSFFAPRWSPDGRSLLIMQSFYEWAADIVLDGLSVPGRMTVVSESGGPMGSMGVWSPDGRRIAYILGGNGFDLGIGLVNGQDASPVSVILLGNVGDREEFVSHFGGAADATLASAPILGGEISSPRWSSDGKALAFCGTQQFRNIYTITFEGSTVKRLTDVQGDACSPFWSSDGEWIVYAVNESSREQEEGIWIVQSDGREHRKLYP